MYEKKYKNLIKYLICILFIIIIAIFFINYKIIRVVGISMEPTYKNNEIVLVERKANDISYDDIVVFELKKETYIKRVLAVSGDIVELKNGYVYINSIIQEPYRYEGEMEKKYVLNEGEVFVIGDNHQYSLDSRSFGTITKEKIVGRVINF